MGLLPKDFWELRPVDYARMQRGYYIREDRKFLHTRKILASIHNAFAEAGKGKSEQEIMPLPYFDKHLKLDKPAKPKKTTYTGEEVEALKRRFGMVKPEKKNGR